MRASGLGAAYKDKPVLHQKRERRTQHVAIENLAMGCEAHAEPCSRAVVQEEAEREFPADVDGPLQPQEWVLRPGLEPEPDPAAAD